MFKNFGATAQKFTFQIDVQKVVLPDMLEHFEGTEQLAVCFERKNYPPIFTRDASITLNDQDEIVSEWHEPLITHATMFKDSKTGLYKEKMGKLNLMQRRPGFMGVSPALDAFKSLGMATVPLHVYANPNKTVTNIKLHLSWCASEHAYLIVDISASLGDNTTPIDYRSETGSVDDNRSDNGTSSATKPSLSSLSSSTNTRQSLTLGAGPSKGVTTIKEEENEEDEDDPFSRHVHSGKKAPPQSTTTGKSNLTSSSSSSRPVSSSSSSVPSTPMSSTEQLKQIGSATSRVAFIGDNPDDKRFQSSQLYQQMKQRIEDLEIALLTSEEVVVFEKNRAREALEIASKLEETLSSTANNNQILSKLQVDFEALKQENKLLKETNNNLSNTLAKYTGEGSKLQTMISKSSDEITFLRDEKVKLERLLRDKNDECENLLSELIKTKVSVGEMAEELEETKKELRTMKAAREKALEARRAREAAANAAAGGGGGGGGSSAPARPVATSSSAPSSAAAPKRPSTGAPTPQSTGATRERPTPQGQGQAQGQGQGQQQQARGGGNMGNNNNNNMGGGGGGYSNYNNGGGNFNNNNNNNNNGGYNNYNDDNMSVNSGYNNYQQQQQQQQQPYGGGGGGGFNPNNNMNNNYNNNNGGGSNFNNNFSNHSSGSAGSGGGYGNNMNNMNNMNNNFNNNFNNNSGYGNNNFGGGGGNGYNNMNNMNDNGRGFMGNNNNNMQTPSNNNGGNSFFTPSSTPSGRVNPFASVGQQVGQMGNNVGNTLLRGFNSVSNVFNDNNGNNNGNPSSATQRRNPPPRPSFN